MKIKKRNLELAVKVLQDLMDVQNTAFSEQVLKCLESLSEPLKELKIESTPESSAEVDIYKKEVDDLYNSLSLPKENDKFKKEYEELNKKHKKAYKIVSDHAEVFQKTLDDLVNVEALINFKSKNIMPKNLTSKHLICINRYNRMEEKGLKSPLTIS